MTTRDEDKKKKLWWNVREIIASVGGLEAAQRYDRYLKDHKERMRDLNRIAGNDSELFRARDQ